MKQLNRSSLLEFIDTVTKCDNFEKAAASLTQLKELMEIQGADASLVKIVSLSIDGVPELRSEGNIRSLSDEFFHKELQQRIQQRKEREAAARYNGRC